jgi:hypothetical protein
MRGNHCSPISIVLWITIIIHNFLFFKNIFFLFYLLIFEWLGIWLCNLFLFILSFYKISMICEFVRATRLPLFMGLVRCLFIFIFYWTWFFMVYGLQRFASFLSFILLLIFSYDFLKNLFLLISFFNIKVVENLAS